MVGSWFANMSVRRSDSVTVEAVTAYVLELMQQRRLDRVEDPEEADGAVVLLASEDAQWITLCSDLLPLEEPKEFAALGTAMSAALHADVLGAACFDSDYLWLNLINADQNLDGWVGIGSGKELGFTRRNKLTPWKKKVRDYDRFARCAKEGYIVADGFLYDTADCLGLPVRQSNAAVDYLKDLDPEKKGVYLYFSLREDARAREKVRLAHYDMGVPCLVGYENHVPTINQGAAGTGLRIWLLLNGADREEVTYDNVYIQRGTQQIPIMLTWEQMADGRWAWCWHDPQFPIPPAVTGRMKQEKRWKLESQRIFSIHFTPRGNSRRTLDIQVGFVPDENPEGGTWWNVLRNYGSKEAFIKEHNRIWKLVRAMEEDESSCLPYLKRADFD